jgi:triacylglycerol lipase
VGLSSAEWGNFRGVLVSETGRGISHGDIIDLKRADYRGFDVTETYVKIVSELKERGF